MHFRFVSMIHSFVLGGHFAVYESKELNADTLKDDKKDKKENFSRKKEFYYHHFICAVN